MSGQARTGPDEPEAFDYVVVGGGSAGCVVAGRLASEPGVRVCVLEAGDPAERNPETLRADGYKDAFINDRCMWERHTVPQTDCAGQRLYVGTGRGMGGSGSVNAMVYTRGSAYDFDSWGIDGWRWRDVAPVFDALEGVLDPHRRPPTSFTEDCIAAAEGEGFARKEDLNDGSMCGHLGYEWMNYRDEERRSSYVSYLKPLAGRDELQVVTNARVHRILFDADRNATGVAFEHEGRLREVRARREVVLTAGALESPRLLLLSGVGPAAELRRHGIAPVLEHEGVGANLHDHPNVPVFFWGGRPTDCKYVQLYGFHRANEGTDLPAGEADSCFVFYTARSSIREGMIRLGPTQALPWALHQRAWIREPFRHLLRLVASSPPARWALARTYGIIVILGKPKSRGTLTLASADPTAPAVIDPRYLSHPEDLETLVHGIELARRVAGQPSLRESWGDRPIAPGRRVRSREQLAAYARRNLITTYHFAGTCRMGEDEASVVDPQLRLRGLGRLRVADASVIPFTPVSALNAPSMMIGHRAAQLALEARDRSPGRSTTATSPAPEARRASA